IEWWHRRMQRVAALTTYIIVHGDAQRRSVLGLKLKGANIVTTTFSSSTRALAELAAREGFDHIALASFGAAFGPIELLKDMVHAHAVSANDLTRTNG